MRPPPTSNIFPYTTLFRSGVEHLEHRAGRVAAEVRAHLVDLVDQEHRVDRLGVAQRTDDRAGHGADVRPAMAADLGLVDRKSTRLNSSHQIISYAVFCLKK